MNHILKAGLDFIIYSSFLISAGAAVLTLEIYYTSGIDIYWPYIAFVFFSTFLIYSLHRVIGIKRIDPENISGRFEIILKYRHHLKIYAFISSVACFFIFFKYFDLSSWIYFLPASLIAVPYVLPLAGQMRLRDVNFIKIFLIAFTWAYVCVALPLFIHDASTLIIDWNAFLEKACFIFAITLPFDIRDAKIDRIENVKTLARSLGVNKAYILSYVLCAASIIFLGNTMFNFSCFADWNLMVAILTYLPVLILIGISKNKTSDYYYSGLLDGSILIRAGILIFFIPQ